MSQRKSVSFVNIYAFDNCHKLSYQKTLHITIRPLQETLSSLLIYRLYVTLTSIIPMKWLNIQHFEGNYFFYFVLQIIVLIMCNPYILSRILSVTHETFSCLDKYYPEEYSTGTKFVSNVADVLPLILTKGWINRSFINFVDEHSSYLPVIVIYQNNMLNARDEGTSHVKACYLQLSLTYHLVNNYDYRFKGSI